MKTGCASAIAVAAKSVGMRGSKSGLCREAGIRQAERERMARDLHDILLQSVHAALWRIDMVARRMPPDDPGRRDLDEAVRKVEAAFEAGRIRMLTPEPVDAEDEWGLVDRLRELGECWSTDTDVRFSMQVANDRPLRLAARIPLMRILAEAVVNAFRHANASSVILTLRFDAASLECAVVDDGVGMDRGVLENGLRGHIGLRLMRERAHALGARLDVGDAQPRGTAVRLSLPAAKAYPPTSFWRRLARAKVRRVRRSPD